MTGPTPLQTELGDGGDAARTASVWQLAFDAAAAELEQLDEMLWANAALSVSAEPASEAPDIFEPDPGATPLWHTLRVLALFASEAEAVAMRELLGDGREIQVQRIIDEDWVQAWRQHVRPQCFGERLWVCPLDERTPAMGPHVVLLDAGLAFGTGAHATTALCLAWLAEQSMSGARVVDFGCGSGILGIAALVLGAQSVQAVDHDPQAHRATSENAENNGVADQLRLVDAGTLAPGCADVLCANILAGTLIELAPQLQSCIADHGVVALSGVLARQADAVMAAYPDVHFEPPRQREDWVCLVGRRRARAPIVQNA